MKRIVLSDESIDSYGERVLMSGCVLDRFLKNPVMLYKHDSWDKPVIGRWKDVRIEGNQLTAEPDFDLNDEFGAEIARKYEEGFLVASSVGFRVIETSNDPAVMLAGQKYSTITKWELFEASIVPLPANPNAIQMKAYNDEYKVKYSPEAKLILDKFLNSNKKPIPKMDKLKSYFNLPETATEDDVINAIKAEKEKTVNTFINAMKRNGSVTEANEKAVKTLAFADMDAVVELLGTKTTQSAKEEPKATTTDTRLSDFLDAFKSGNGSGAVAKTLPDWKELERKNPNELKRLKSEEPETYKEMFKNRFGKYPENVK